MSKCETCEVKVTSKDKRVQCSACEKWYHSKCQNVDDQKHLMLSQPTNKDIHWLCNTCNSQSAKIFIRFAQMAEKVEKMEENFKDIKDEVGSIRKQMGEFLQLSKSTEAKLSSLIEAKIDQDVVAKVEKKVTIQVQMVQEDVKEKLEIERRRSNIVIHGLKDSREDAQQEIDGNAVKKVINEGLKLDAQRHVEEVYRIGKFNAGKCRPIRIKIKTMEGRSEILKRAKMLKETELFSKVYISLDLTKKQQSKDKELRDKLKEMKEAGEEGCMIRNGKIIKNGEGNQVKVLFLLEGEC